ncbi:MAG: TlpA family protein disulfide reductase [Armatimonadetes bacterium]|nr:TlpA family protein disulfide reductase [Armatimonadota bacterium]
MKHSRTITVLSVALGLLAATVLGARALAAGDPEQSLKDINTWYAGEIQKARDEKKNPDFRALMAERVKRAKAAVEGVSAASADPAKCLALAQLYQAATMPKEAGVAAERFLTSDPAAREKYSAQQIVLTACQSNRDADGLVRVLGEMQPPDSRSAAFLASATAQLYGDTVAAKLGPQAALDLIGKLEAKVPFDKMTTPQDKQASESAIVQIAMGRHDLLKAKGDEKGALVPLEDAIKKLGADHRMARQLVGKINQAKLVGSVAPEIKKERGYGQFDSLAAWRGRVVVIDFGAHWCGFCKLGYPSMKKMLADLKPQGFDIVEVTRYYGYYKTERNITPDQEYAKYAEHIKEFETPWPVVFGDQSNQDNYGVGGIPHYVLIDRKGVVRAMSIGFSEALHAKFRAEVEKVVAEK